MSPWTERLFNEQSRYAIQATKDLTPVAGTMKRWVIAPLFTLSVSLILHAIAVCKVVYVCFLAIREIFAKTDKQLLAEQKVQCVNAYAKSLQLFFRKKINVQPPIETPLIEFTVQTPPVTETPVSPRMTAPQPQPRASAPSDDDYHFVPKDNDSEAGSGVRVEEPSPRRRPPSVRTTTPFEPVSAASAESPFIVDPPQSASHHSDASFENVRQPSPAAPRSPSHHSAASFVEVHEAPAATQQPATPKSPSHHSDASFENVRQPSPAVPRSPSHHSVASFVEVHEAPAATQQPATPKSPSHHSDASFENVRQPSPAAPRSPSHHSEASFVEVHEAPAATQQPVVHQSEPRSPDGDSEVYVRVLADNANEFGRAAAPSPNPSSDSSYEKVEEAPRRNPSPHSDGSQPGNGGAFVDVAGVLTPRTFEEVQRIKAGKPPLSFVRTPLDPNLESQMKFSELRLEGGLEAGSCHFVSEPGGLDPLFLGETIRVRMGKADYAIQLFGMIGPIQDAGASTYLKAHLSRTLAAELTDENREGISKDKIIGAIQKTFINLNALYRKENKPSLTDFAVGMIFDNLLWTAQAGNVCFIHEGTARIAFKRDPFGSETYGTADVKSIEIKNIRNLAIVNVEFERAAEHANIVVLLKEEVTLPAPQLAQGLVRTVVQEGRKTGQYNPTACLALKIPNQGDAQAGSWFFSKWLPWG
jgi:hypothetical protein